MPASKHMLEVLVDVLDDNGIERRKQREIVAEMVRRDDGQNQSLSLTLLGLLKEVDLRLSGG